MSLILSRLKEIIVSKMNEKPPWTIPLMVEETGLSYSTINGILNRERMGALDSLEKLFELFEPSALDAFRGAPVQILHIRQPGTKQLTMCEKRGGVEKYPVATNPADATCPECVQAVKQTTDSTGYELTHIVMPGNIVKTDCGENVNKTTQLEENPFIQFEQEAFDRITCPVCREFYKEIHRPVTPKIERPEPPTEPPKPTDDRVHYDYGGFINLACGVHKLKGIKYTTDQDEVTCLDCRETFES